MLIADLKEELTKKLLELDDEKTKMAYQTTFAKITDGLEEESQQRQDFGIPCRGSVAIVDESCRIHRWVESAIRTLLAHKGKHGNSIIVEAVLRVCSSPTEIPSANLQRIGQCLPASSTLTSINGNHILFERETVEAMWCQSFRVQGSEEETRALLTTINCIFTLQFDVQRRSAVVTPPTVEEVQTWEETLTKRGIFYKNS
jgi:hypothetical protein